DGAPASGVRVVRSRSSLIPASAPEVGDWVRVTARTARDGEPLLELWAISPKPRHLPRSERPSPDETRSRHGASRSAPLARGAVGSFRNELPVLAGVWPAERLSPGAGQQHPFSRDPG